MKRKNKSNIQLCIFGNKGELVHVLSYINFDMAYLGYLFWRKSGFKPKIISA